MRLLEQLARRRDARRASAARPRGAPRARRTTARSSSNCASSRGRSAAARLGGARRPPASVVAPRERRAALLRDASASPAAARVGDAEQRSVTPGERRDDTTGRRARRPACTISRDAADARGVGDRRPAELHDDHAVASCTTDRQAPRPPSAPRSGSAAPAAPRTVLWPSATNFAVEHRARPQAADRRPSCRRRARASRRGCGRFGCVAGRRSAARGAVGSPSSCGRPRKPSSAARQLLERRRLLELDRDRLGVAVDHRHAVRRAR